jgi:hypothetical protein
VAIVLIVSLSFWQIFPAYASANGKSIRVAFIGIKFEEIAPDIQEKILQSVTEILMQETSFQVLKPAAVRQAIGFHGIDEFLDRQDKTALQTLAEQLDAQYIFAGHLINNSRDPNRILLDGELIRFHSPTQGVLSFRILTYYEDLGVELVKFYQTHVNPLTLAPEAKTKKLKIWPLVVIGGLAVAGILSYNTLGQAGSRDREGPEPPEK